MGLLLCLSGFSAAQEPSPSPPPVPQASPTPEPTPEPTPQPAAEPTPQPAAGPSPEPAERPSLATPGAPTITLDAAVNIALEHSFSILTSADDLVSARLREDTAHAQFLPKITPSYARGTDDSRIFGLQASQKLPYTGASFSASGAYRSQPTSDIAVPRSSDVSLTLTQPLLRGIGPTATNFDLENARRGRQGQERIFELARQRLALQVAQTFYNVIKQRHLLDVARQSLQRNSNLQEASDARMKVGLASKLDVYRAEIRASQAEDAMVSSQAGLDTALEQFRVLLGLSPTETLEPEDQALPETDGGEIEPEQVLLARAVDNRLEIKEARDLVGDSERAATIAKQSLLPQLDLGLSYIRTGFGTTFTNSLRVADERFAFFFSTSYPLERSADKNSKAVAELQVEARKRSLKQQEFDVQAEVRAAIRSLERIKKSVELQRKGVELADEEHRLATLRYQRGLASNLEVVDAESSLVLARNALVSLLTDYQVARMELLRATGSLDLEKEFPK
jgi:outer membrane protein TolC